ncbi:melatonin receptor 1B [Rhinolophus ferrumequinum]|uniref:Melatonin receptor 1B n=1 Tax=Rhinolophus ferrumequinum TaxID=59479 RepID=A0A7J7W881_RHIFE|nr:melatonin receptor 1B [Rhinolophus ferrumequinum]
MLENVSFANCCEPGGRTESPGLPGEGGARPSGTPRPPWVAPALAAVLIVTTVVDVLGNLLVILSVGRNRKLRNAGNWFLVSLALADLMVAFYPYPLILVAVVHNGWALGERHCKASALVKGLSVIGSVFSITAIAVNRCCYICRSVAYRRLCQHWHAPVYICLIWLLTVLALVPNFFMGSLEYDPRIFSCTFIQTASAPYTAAVTRRKAPSESTLRLRPSDIWGFLTTFLVFVIFAICWAPLNCIGLAVAINPGEMAPQVPGGLFVIRYVLAYFNSCLNAIIYGLLNQNFRREYKKIVLSLWNPRLCLEATSKGSRAEEQQRQALPVLNAQHPI